MDYQAALTKIERIVKENEGQIDSSTKVKKTAKKEAGEDSNDELYDQAIDENEIKVSAYAQEYNEVISAMSQICRHLIWNNNPANTTRKV